jgi:hypothetical protein
MLLHGEDDEDDDDDDGNDGVLRYILCTQSHKVADSILDEVIEHFNLPNPSSHTMVSRFTLPFNRTEYQKMFLGSKARPLHNVNNLTAICEPIV